MDDEKQDEREEPACELLGAFVPDLLTRTENDAFMRRLLVAAPGRWITVRSLCGGIEGADDFFRSLARLSDTELFVVWLEHPGDASDFVFIQFYSERYFWTFEAIFSRSAFDG
jgi:hypothetical protein